MAKPNKNLNYVYNDLHGYYRYKIGEFDRKFIGKFVEIQEEYSYPTEIVYYINSINLRKLKLEILSDLDSQKSKFLKKLIHNSKPIGMEELFSMEISKEIDRDIIKKLVRLSLNQNDNYDEYH